MKAKRKPRSNRVASDDGLGFEPPREVWVVSSKEGCDFVVERHDFALEHAGIMAADFPELGPWRVCKYVAERFKNKQEPPNEKWCVGCSPENCSCCGT
jgi:hypothetical protein